MGENDVECGCIMCLEDKVERQQAEISQLRCELHEAGKIIGSLQMGLESAWAWLARTIEERDGAQTWARLWKRTAKTHRFRYRLVRGWWRFQCQKTDQLRAEIARLRGALIAMLGVFDIRGGEPGPDMHAEAAAYQMAEAALKGTEDG